MLKETIYEYKKYFQEGVITELRSQQNTRRVVALQAGQLVSNVRTASEGISARVRNRGLWGLASIAADGSDTAAAQRVLRAATDNAKFMADRQNYPYTELRPGIIGRHPLIGTVLDPIQDEYLRVARAIDAYIVEKYPDLVSRMVYAIADTVEKVITVSDGYDAHVVTPRSYVYIGLIAMSPDGSPVEVFRAFGGWGTIVKNFADPSVLFPEVDRLYEAVRAKSEGIYPEAGRATCVISGELGGMLAHEAVGHTVEADLVASGSVAAGKIGQPVASELVSMVDFAHTAYGSPAPLPVYVDDEGVVAEDAVLIRDGILTGYMHNRESAAKMGMEARGNARAWDFSDEPLIRMRNTAILPGKDKLDDLIASVDNGYYLVTTGNGQADMTGEFMFGVTEGYEIKKGKLGRALRDTTISGVAFEMLKTVDMVADELTWVSSGFCGKKQPMTVGLGGPALRCKLMIGGR